MTLRFSVILILFCCLSVEMSASMRRFSSGMLSKGGTSALSHAGLGVNMDVLQAGRRNLLMMGALGMTGSMMLKTASGKLLFAGLKAGAAAIGKDKIASWIVQKYSFLKSYSTWISTAVSTMLIMNADKWVTTTHERQVVLEKWYQLMEQMQEIQDQIDAISKRSDVSSAHKKILIEQLQSRFERQFKIWLQDVPEDLIKVVHQKLRQEQSDVVRQDIVDAQNSWWNALRSSEDVEQETKQALVLLDSIERSGNQKISRGERVQDLIDLTTEPNSTYKSKDVFDRAQRLMNERRQAELLKEQQERELKLRQQDADLWHAVAPGHE